MICSVVCGELLYGAERSIQPTRERAKVDAFAAKLGSYPYDDAAARIYSRVKFGLEKRGLPIGENPESDPAIEKIRVGRANCTVTDHRLV